MAKKPAAKRGDKTSLSATPRPLRSAIRRESADNEAEARRRADDERWSLEKETLRRAAADLAQRRAKAEMAALSDLTRVGKDDSFQLITRSLEDPSSEVRNASVRALYLLNPELAASFFNRALREGPPDQRRRIGAALAGSGLVGDAINSLTSDSQGNRYRVFSLLFLVAKAGEVQPLISVIESHPSIELRLALIELLALSGEAEIVPVFRRLATSTELASEVRSAVREAIYQLNSQTHETSVA